MKHWPSQLFPIAIATLLAALSFLLMRAVEFPSNDDDAKARHDPDGIVENFTVLRYGPDGTLRYRLVAPYMEHYPDDDSTLLRQPRLTSYRPNSPEVLVLGDHGQVTSKGRFAYLWDNVEAHRQATDKRAELVARMPDLTVDTEENTGFTNNPVEITQGPSWMKGVGMYIDNKASTFELRSQVTGQYFRPNATP